MTRFRLFHTEKFCRWQWGIDENSGKYSERVENVVGKGAISPFAAQCFKKICTADM